MGKITWMSQMKGLDKIKCMDKLFKCIGIFSIILCFCGGHRAHALMAPYFESVEEIKLMLEDPGVVEIFSKNGSPPIQSLERTEDGFKITTGPLGGKCTLRPSATCIDNCILLVKVVHKIPVSKEGQQLIGGEKIDIVPGKLICTKS